jgi:hypothetical protein
MGKIKKALRILADRGDKKRPHERCWDVNKQKRHERAGCFTGGPL